MGELNPVGVNEVRERVTTFLAFVSSDTCLEIGHRFLSPERLAFELCRLWFDEIYTPGIRYVDGLKGNYSEAAAQHFLACFTPQEQAALERFHRFFELRVDMLPSTWIREALFPQNDAWGNIRKDAGHVLQELVVDPEALRSQLASTLQSWLERDEAMNGLATGPWLERLIS